VERALKIDVPTREEQQETLSGGGRPLHDRHGLYQTDTAEPATTPITSFSR
jgi:hypothetical protein